MNKIISGFLLFFTIILTGCLKDNPTKYHLVEITNNIEILTYLESAGDYINASAPSLVECEEVFNNIGSYLILDVRNSGKFSSGHIHSSVNITSDSLFDFVKEYTDNFLKIVVVSETGHSSAYYTSLLRLAGFNNVYSMKYGMSYWHNDFAEKWIESINYNPDRNKFVQEDYEKNKYSDLPVLIFSDDKKSVNEKIEERIRLLLAEGFAEDDAEANTPFESSNIITIEKIYENFESEGSGYLYIVCYGTQGLYKAPKSDPFPEQGHPRGTVLYEKPDFQSINYLQTLPLNRTVAIYDYNGQSSSFLTAYLKLLGYDAKTILYGANHFFYYRLLSQNSPEAFYPSLIRNFTYDR